MEYCNIRSKIKKTIKHINHKKINKINVNDIYFKYSKNTNNYIFRSFSYQFEFGKSYCISAPSGHGKSTLIDLLLGLLQPSKGSILYSGGNISYKAGEFSKVEFISYVPQSKFDQQFMLFLIPHSGRIFWRLWEDLVPKSSMLEVLGSTWAPL